MVEKLYSQSDINWYFALCCMTRGFHWLQLQLEACLEDLRKPRAGIALCIVTGLRNNLCNEHKNQ